MLIELDSIFENEGSRFDFDHTVKTEGSDIPADSCFVSGIHCKGMVSNRTGLVTLSGEADFDYCGACDRCAAEVTRHFTVPFSHKLIHHLESEDQDEYILIDGASLDLDSLVYEDVVLSLPMQFLCREDCKGLCPMCGADLNRETCRCKKPSDSRLDALKQLLENEQ